MNATILPWAQSLVHPLLETLDLAGTFAFAVSGAALAVKKGLDLFGVLTLAFVAATAGGIVRDLMIGAVPPAAVASPRYLVVALSAGGVVFLRYPSVAKAGRLVDLFDAAGLSLSSVAGAEKALDAGLDPVMATVLGMLGGMGGGIARDLLVARTPAVLRTDVYAVAALLGAALATTGRLLLLPPAVVAIVSASCCMGLRLAAARSRWRLPVARQFLDGEGCDLE